MAPIEILIKVQQPKSSRIKRTKKIKVRCIDTLSKEPGKVYPRTPFKKSKRDHREVECAEDDTNKMADLIAAKLLEKQKLCLDPPKTVEPSVTKVPPKVTKSVEKKSNKYSSKVTKPVSISTQTSSVKHPQAVQTNDQQKQPELRPPVVIRDDASSIATISTSYNSLPHKLQSPSNPPLRLNVQDQNRQLNPTLMHYVTRLLGMSQNIGNKLGVSVSSVSTPGSSVIHTSTNISEVQELSFDNDRMEKLKKFIGDNYNFLNEINESLERSKMSGTVEENVNKVENIWRNVLEKKGKRQESPPKPPRARPATAKDSTKVAILQKSQRTEVIKAPIKPAKARPENVMLPPPRTVRPQSSSTQPVPKKTILKSPPAQQAPIPQQAPQVGNNDLLNMTKYLESHMLNNYVEYTNNCQKRISDLTEMMGQVRQEKLKLIENSLSSSEMQNFTEYKDIQVITIKLFFFFLEIYQIYYYIDSWTSFN